jgi:hypothetical protein
MPIQIDELTADVTPAPPPAAGAEVRTRPARDFDPEALRRELERLAARAERLAAD